MERESVSVMFQVRNRLTFGGVAMNRSSWFLFLLLTTAVLAGAIACG
jgi:hypothetical protein